MQRLVIVLSVLGLLLVSACSAGPAITIENSNGRRIGEIRIEGTQAILLNSVGEERGRVRGTMIRDADGKRAGSLAEQEGNLVILDINDSPVGSLEEGVECYGKGQDMLGKVTAPVDSHVAAAACLLFFLQ